MERTLVLIRHGQSDWNLKNLFTGWKDPDLSEKGVDEARAASRLVSTSLRFGTAAVKLESVEAELNPPLPLREGMLLVLTPRMGRPMLLC